ncbi:MAG TPA: hypothetical protein VHA10_04070 [Hypericibacter adhaerens]|jgi:hypothetical protein|uniref:Uncharacterized protein n=1 Tax=Hypericibacter adhaerens TaxID=2602016 RepID=A0A5J6NA56_9PROT|nr:hypothetical protein [Hypericibacter adhaerens]QEX24546.1 hypothetical protein FRZ61_44870 [Hypericibacter adhaerens]HWA42362.1 hypothetical protein [Hypericibacter adhaerens]
MPSDLGCSDAGPIHETAAAEAGGDPLPASSVAPLVFRKPAVPDVSDAAAWLSSWLVPLA